MAALLEMRDLELAGELRKDRYRNVGRRKRTVFAGGVFVTFRRRYYYDRLERRYLFPLDVVLGIPPRSSTTDAESARIASMAMEMPYSAVARWASRGPDTISASTVCRRVAACEVLAGERKAGLRPDGAAFEAMIDEKYVPIWREKGKRPIYTATLHAGLEKGPGGRDSLRNKTVLCSLDCLELRKMVAEAAEASYSASSAPERFVSGDLAPYIRSFPGSEEGPGFRYVPDKWHVCRACSLLSPGGKRVKAAGVKAFLSSIERRRGKAHLADPETGEAVEIEEPRVLLGLLAEGAFDLWDHPLYSGCSQEGMNSHYVARRLAKLPGGFKAETALKIASYSAAAASGAGVRIAAKPLGVSVARHVELEPRRHEEPARPCIDLSGFKRATRLMLSRLIYGGYVE